MNRNDPCPCGSGKRYKHCHGAIGNAPPDPLHAEAEGAIRAGALGHAESLYRRRLAQDRGDIESLHRLGMIEFERLHFGPALEYLWEALERSGWSDAVIRQNLGLVLAKLLAPSANARQEAIVDKYSAREHARRAAPALAPLVSVVLAIGGEHQQIERALASVAAQDYPDIELIVVGSGEAVTAARANGLSGFPFPSRVFTAAERGMANAVNEGAARARGSYLSLLEADDAYVRTRIARMVAQIARAAPLWGYSRIAGIAASVRSVELPSATVAGPRDEPLNQPASFSLLERDDLAASGNLFAERGLFLELGGYRNDATNPGWEFGRRASLAIEPVVVEERLYLRGERATSAGGPGSGSASGQDSPPETLAVEALAATGVPGNEFSPRHPANRDVLLRSELRAGHADRLPVAMLRSLAAEWRARDNDRARHRPGPAPLTSQPRVAIVVLGIYRSGTSAFSRTLNLCGASVAEQVRAARLGLNPRGFWESEAINDIDARLLHRLGGNWDRVPVELPRDGPLVDEFMTQAQELLAFEYRAQPLILIKDPRVCILAPLWHRALAGSGYRPVYVVTVRNPLEVARSLESQGELPVPGGIALWHAYMSRVERFASEPGVRVAYARYADLLDDWREVVRRIAATLDVTLDTESRAGEVDRYLETTLRTYKATTEELEGHLTGTSGDDVRALYRRLVERSERSVAAPA